MCGRSIQRPLSWCSSAVSPVFLSPVRLSTDLPMLVFATTRPRVCSWIHSTVRVCLCSSTRQTLLATSSTHFPLRSMGSYRTFLNALRVSNSYLRSLRPGVRQAHSWRIDCVLAHRPFPGSQVGGDYAWISPVVVRQQVAVCITMRSR